MAPKIFVALPAYGRTNVSDTTGALYELGATFGANGIYGGFATASHTNIGQLRNVFLTAFYDKTDATHILMTDADMRFRALLVMEMIKFNQPVVGVVYRKKSPSVEWVGRGLPENPEPVDGFLEMAGVGGGLLLISRPCVEEMVRKFPELVDDRPPHRQPAKVQVETAKIDRVFRFFDPLQNEFGDELSEDLSFCERWRSIGGKVYANIQHPITHIGMADFGGSYQQHLASRATKPTVSLAG